MSYRIFYFRGGILEDAHELAAEDLLEATRAASMTHPALTAEIWTDGRKVAIVGPSRAHTIKSQQELQSKPPLLEQESVEATQPEPICQPKQPEQ